MLKKLIDKVKLLEKLQKSYNEIKLDDWNEFTRSWSKGYKKGAEDTIKLVVNYEDKDE